MEAAPAHADRAPLYFPPRPLPACLKSMRRGNQGVNAWRRFFIAHVIPRRNGAILAPKSAMCNNGGGIEFTKANEENQLEGIAFVKENLPGVGVWWIDAGWYPCLNESGEHLPLRRQDFRCEARSFTRRVPTGTLA